METQELKNALADHLRSTGFKQYYYQHNLEDIFIDELDEIMPPFMFGTIRYDAGRTLKEIDPICFDQEFSAWLDSNENYLALVESEIWIDADLLQEFFDGLDNNQQLIQDLFDSPYVHADFKALVNDARADSMAEQNVGVPNG